ncbi:MAG: TA system VapC family ribonuclease toxin [Solirubrobacterales bacterium]
MLLYARDSSSTHHARARAWLEETLSGTETVAFAWIPLLAFLRVSTNLRVFTAPLAVDDALDLIDVWLAQPNATVIHPGDRHPAILRELVETSGTAGNRTSDAQLAALAIEHGATLATFDSDFHRFSGVKLERLA